MERYEIYTAQNDACFLFLTLGFWYDYDKNKLPGWKYLNASEIKDLFEGIDKQSHPLISDYYNWLNERVDRWEKVGCNFWNPEVSQDDIDEVKAGSFIQFGQYLKYSDAKYQRELGRNEKRLLDIQQKNLQALKAKWQDAVKSVEIENPDFNLKQGDLPDRSKFSKIIAWFFIGNATSDDPKQKQTVVSKKMASPASQ